MGPPVQQLESNPGLWGGGEWGRRHPTPGVLKQGEDSGSSVSDKQTRCTWGGEYPEQSYCGLLVWANHWEHLKSALREESEVDLIKEHLHRFKQGVMP